MARRKSSTQLPEPRYLHPTPDRPEGWGAFSRRPDFPPYSTHSVGLSILGKYDAERMMRRVRSEGWRIQSLKSAWDEGHDFSVVQLRMQYLPTVVMLGGKEIRRDSPEGRTIIEFMHVFGIACALLGVSGVAGAGHGAMAFGQEGMGLGKELIRPTPWIRQQLFPKCGVAAVPLAIAEEEPNPFVTPGWRVRPCRDLSIRKGRLFSLGIPLLAIFFEGGDATLDELTYLLTLTKESLVRQLDTPFTNVGTRIAFVDQDVDPAFWESWLDWYCSHMNSGDRARRKRKAAEFKRLREGHVKVGDPLRATRRVIKVLDSVAEQIYGTSLVALWERRTGASFWDVVAEFAAKPSRARRK